MSTIPLSDLDAEGTSAPLIDVPHPAHFEPTAEVGASRYRHTFPGDRHLDVLLVNRATETLVVAFHGALERNRYVLPRFERFASLNRFDVSAIYFTDPALWADPNLSLAWYTGWDGLDLYTLLAEMTLRTAARIGAKNIIISGGSGGGFAALQVSALLPGSLALVYNPQTSIYGYLHPKWPYVSQKVYLRAVWPDLLDVPVDQYDFADDWTLPLGDRLSALRRYATPRDNRVLYVTNVQDAHHHEDHFKPFAETLASTPERLQVLEYKGGEGHIPTPFEQYRSGLLAAAEWTGFHVGQ